MSKVEFSKEQLSVINARDKSVLVSAAAGSGKSTVLVERIINLLINDNVDIDKLLVVTFTKAAAGGMKEKIAKALKSALSENPSDKRLKKQLLLLGSGNISTVHAYLSKVISKYSYRLPEDIPAGMKIMDETENEVLRREVLNNIIDELYEKDDEIFSGLIERYAPGKTDDSLNEMLLGIYDKLISSPFYNKQLERTLKLIKSGERLEGSIYEKQLVSHVKKILNSFVSKYKFALKKISAEEGLFPYLPVFTDELAAISETLTANDYKSLKEKVLKLRYGFVRLPSAKRGTDNFIPKDIREKFKKTVESLCVEFFSRTDDEIAKESVECYPYISEIFDIITEFDKRYKSEKFSKNQMDFNDLEHIALSLLCEDEDINRPSAAALEIRDGFYEILVDEYQDTNELQEAIFRLISRNEENLVMVGDIKQSIYRFRHAKPDLFIERQREYESEDGKNININLNCNYRSRSEVLSFVNHIFDKVMSLETGEINYKKSERLKYFEGNYGASENMASEIMLVTSETAEGEKSAVPCERLEGRAIAARIKKMVYGKELVLRNGTPKFGDIVILVRSFNKKTLAMLDEIRGQGIPLLYDEKKNLFETPEIKIVLSLLKVVDNPYDDISLLSVLKNIFGFEYEEFVRLREEDRDSEFYEILLHKKEDEKIKKVLDYIDELREFTVKRGLSKLIEKLYKDTFLRELQFAYKSGEQKRENLNLLARIAGNFEDTGFKGISAFITYINKIIESKKKVGVAAGQGENVNAVSVMTIHKSKGLEFPVVFLAGADREFNQQDLRDRFIVDSELGIGFDYFDMERRYKYPTLIKNIIRKKEKWENLCEELRILYVGLTRAKEKLVVSGAADNLDRALSRYLSFGFAEDNAVTYYDFMRAVCYFDFIIPAAAEHKSFYETVKDESIDVKALDFDMKTEIVRPSDSGETENPEDADIDFGKDISKDFIKSMDKLLNFEYNNELTGIPQKISVSALRKIADDSALNADIELNDEKLSDNLKITDKGILIHYILEKVSFEEIKNKGARAAVLELYSSTPYLSEQLSVKEAEKAAEFFETDIGKMLVSSGHAEREKDFLITIPAREIYDGVGSDESVIIQGIIDCYFEYEDKIILIDYKYSKMDSEYLFKTYRLQLELYKKALSKSLGIPEKKINACIWNIRRNKLITI